MVQTGKRFESRMKSWIKDSGALCYKWPDHASTGTMQKALCDLIALTRNRSYFFECKHTNSKTSFSLQLIKDHQWVMLLEAYQHCSYVYFAIEDGNKNVYIINPWQLKKLTKGQKSIKFDDLFMVRFTKKDFCQWLRGEYV